MRCYDWSFGCDSVTWRMSGQCLFFEAKCKQRFYFSLSFRSPIFVQEAKCWENSPLNWTKLLCATTINLCQTFRFEIQKTLFRIVPFSKTHFENQRNLKNSARGAEFKSPSQLRFLIPKQSYCIAHWDRTWLTSSHYMRTFDNKT